MSWKKWVLTGTATLATYAAIGQVDSVHQYIATVKGAGVSAASTNISLSEADQKLYERIAVEAAKLEEQPINARVDSVWKAIPGYNGVRVDKEKTMQLAKSSKNGVVSFVFEEVPPTITLDHLPPNPIYKGNPRKPMVSFMINVAWGDEHLPSILQTLEKENVHATFFFDGSWLSKHVDTAKQIGAKGHELSNHAYSHKNMSQLGRSAAVSEIEKTERLLRESLGIQNKLFAPPSGDFDTETVVIAKELGLRTVLWTIDTVDWRKPEPAWIVRRITSRLEPGAMILMHPTASSSAALEEMIHAIKSKGLSIGTVSELLSPARVHLPSYEMKLVN